jgi:nucleotide-binding universal stress UspA family protein
MSEDFMSKSIEKVLYAVDLGENAKQALSMALHLVKTHKAKLILLHVVEPLRSSAMDSVAMYFPQESLKELHERSIEEVKDNIDKQIKDLYSEQINSELPDKNFEIHVLSGVPAPTIIKTAVKMDVDLVVMGSHSHGILDNLFLGSVANKVVNRSTKPVLLVPINS